MKREIRLFFMLCFILIFQGCSKSEKKEQDKLMFVFYNVENLFDTIDEPGKEDEEFTPESEKQWTHERYEKKLEDLSKVLASVSSDELPDIIGLAEVENEQVVADLKNTRLLAAAGYEIVHSESPDVRGIDCALLYKPDRFKVINRFPIRVEFVDNPDYKTRDILYVKGSTNNGETFHVFVNHWPSRIGGTEQTEKQRIEVAKLLRNKIDSIFNTNSDADIIVMGDMNDEPSNKSLNEILGAKKPGSQSKLVNLMYPDDLQGEGTYYYQGEWNMLDNLIISSGLLDDEGFKNVEKKGFIFRMDWMEYTNNDGISTPDRTYGGSRYYGGVSDHFPVWFSLKQ